MAYDFGRKPGGLASVGARGGDPAPAAGAPKAPAAASAPERMPVTRLDGEKQLVFGDDIWANPVPGHTASARERLHLIFEDPQGRRFGLDASALSKHLLLIGGIGSGKTNVFDFITESVLDKQSPEDVVFIFDTKGDFCEQFYRAYDRHHVLIGNAEKYAGTSAGWNVFGELEGRPGAFRRSDEFTAKEIGKQFFRGRGSETQPFFELAAADLVAKVMIDFERQAEKTGDRSRLNNRELAAWFRRATIKEYMELLGRNPDFVSAQLYFGDPGSGSGQKLTAQALGVFGYINSMLNDLFTGIFEGPCPGGEFSMRKLVRERGADGGRTVVFVEYDLSAGEVLGPMYRLLFDLAMKEALGQDGVRKGNVIFIIDEFKLLPDLMHIDDALNFGRSLGVKVFAGLQSIDQIYEIYGEERGRSILSGFMNCFCFQTPDSSSRRYASERFGSNCSQIIYRSLDEPASFQREGHVVEDWDLVKLKLGQAAVDLNGESPFIFQFSDFRKPHPIL